MAAASENDCLNDPNFAVICNFLDRYGEMIGLGDISYTDLQTWLEDTKHVPSFLVDLHVKLLRRMGKSSVSTERWERYVIKFIHTYSNVDAWEVERFGYKHCKITTKLTILKNLLEKQFDFNSKFKEQINAKPAEDMRFEPLGRDKNGLAYWYLIDKEFNVRVYREDQDDVDAETWEVVCKSRNELAQLIGTLENQIQNSDVKEETESESENTNGDFKRELSDNEDSDKDTNGFTNLKKEPDKMDEVDGVTEDKKDDADDKKNVDVVKCEKRDVDQEVKMEVKEECSLSLEETTKVREETTKVREEPTKVKEESMQEENFKDSVKVEDGVGIKQESSNVIKEESTEVKMDDSIKTEDSLNNKEALPSEAKVDKSLGVDIKPGEDPPCEVDLKDKVGKERNPQHDKGSSEEVKEIKAVDDTSTDDKTVKMEENVSKSDDISKEQEKEKMEENVSKEETEKLVENISKTQDISMERVEENINSSEDPEKVAGHEEEAVKSQTFDASETKSESTNSDTVKSEEQVENKEVDLEQNPVSNDESKSVNTCNSTKPYETDGNLKSVSTEEISHTDKEKCDKVQSQEVSSNEGTSVSEEKSLSDTEVKTSTVEVSSHNEDKTPMKCKMDSQEEEGISSKSKEGETEAKSSTNNDKEISSKEESESKIKSSDLIDKETNSDSSLKISSEEDKDLKNESAVDSINYSDKKSLNEKEDAEVEETVDSKHSENETIDKSVEEKVEKKEEISHSSEQDKKSDAASSKGDENQQVNLYKTGTGIEDEEKAEEKDLQNAPSKEVIDDATVNDIESDKDVSISLNDANKSQENDPINKGQAKNDQEEEKKEEKNEESKIESEKKEESKIESEKTPEKAKQESLMNEVRHEKDPDTVKQSTQKTKKPNLKGRKRGIEFDESAEDSPVEPNSKKAKDGKKIIPRGKRRTPKKVDSSSDSDDIPLSKIGNKSGDSAKKRTESSTPSRKSTRPVKKKKVSSDDEEEEESLKKTKSKRRNIAEKPSESEDEEEGPETTKKGSSKKSKPPTKKTKKQEEQAASDDDLPLKNSKTAKNTKAKTEDPAASDEDDQGRRRSARVKNMRKKKDPTPEPSSFEEDNVDTEFEVGSEEETSDDDFTPTKGRNAQRQEARKRQLEEDEAEEEIPNDTPCCKCQKTHQPEWLLLCDKCDAAFHTACLRPPLMIIPDGDWYCPPCEHKSLVSRLQENLKDLDTNLKKHERIIKRKQRLAYVGISLDNILKEEYKEKKENIAPDEEEYESEESQKSFNPKPRKSKYIKRTCRQKNTISYKFEDFDDMIDKAIKQEVEEVKEYKKHNYGRSRGKDMANIYEAEGREYIPSDEEKLDKPPPVVNRKKRTRRLTTLDSDEDDDQGDESEEFHLSDETVSEVPEEDQEDTEDEEEISDYSEDGEGWRSGRRSTRKPTRRSSRKRGRHSIFKDFVVDEDEDSEENKRTARRSARKRVTYRDPSSEEEAETEETEEESFDSEDLCSEDSDSKNKKSKKKIEIAKKKKKLETSSETEQESEGSVVKKKSKSSSKKKTKKKVEESESDSEEERNRRSRRNVKKIDFKSLMMSETESEDGGKSSKKKKKVCSSESGSSDETGSESEEEEEEVVKKKKNVIRDESSGTDEYEPEDKNSKLEEKVTEKSEAEDKTEEKTEEPSADSFVVKSDKENMDTKAELNVPDIGAVPPNPLNVVTSENSSIPMNRGFEDQALNQNVLPQQHNMYSNFSNVPQGPQNVGFLPPQQFPNQRLPYSGMDKPVFQPQPGPMKSPPHLPTPPNHPHSHNQRHISSPPQGISSPPPFTGQNRMASPPHQMTSPSHSQAPPHSQMNPRMSYPSPQHGPRPGDPQRFPNSPPPVPSSQGTPMQFDPRIHQNRMPMDYRGPHPRMLNNPNNPYSQYGNLPPGPQAMNFQNQMRLHGSVQSRMEGPGQMEPVSSSPGGPLTSLGQMVVPGYQGPSQQIPRPGGPQNSMNMGMPRHNMPPIQQSPHNIPQSSASQNTGMLPNTQGQHMPSNIMMQNMPPSSSSSQSVGFNVPSKGMPPAYPGQTPSFSNSSQSTTPPASDAPKAGSKRGRPKGSKSKKKKDATAENESSKSPGSSPQIDAPKFPFPVPPNGEMDQRQMHPAGVPENLQRPMMPGHENRGRPSPYVGRNEAIQGHSISHATPQPQPPSDSSSRPPDPKEPSTEDKQRLKDNDKSKRPPENDTQKKSGEEAKSNPSSDVKQKPILSEGSSKQGAENETGGRQTGKEMMHRPPMGAVGQRPLGPEMGHPIPGPDMGQRPMIPPSSQMGQHPMPPQFSDMSQRMMHPGMMPPRMMDSRGMPMLPQGHPMRAPMSYPGFAYGRDQYGINGHPASIHSSMQDPSSFSSMNPAMLSSPHQNPMMHPSHVAPTMGGGRGFMIANLLEKNQKSAMSSFSENLEEGASTSAEGKGDSSQIEQEYGPGYQGDQEEEGVSDIADIVKCFKA